MLTVRSTAPRSPAAVCSNHATAAGNTPATCHRRADGRASFGYAATPGHRPAQEDYTTAGWHPAPSSSGASSGASGGNGGGGSDASGGAPCSSGQVGFFGVFDGHGGPNAATFVQEHLSRNLLAHPQFHSEPKTALVEAFEQTDIELLNETACGSMRDDGCTAVTALLAGQRLLVAHVGDSRAVLARGGKAIALSTDHKPSLREERVRIEEAGGVVVWAGTWRVSGVLAVSRAFGDRPLKRYVIATPDVRDEMLTSRDDCVILASDGLWDVLSNQEAVAIASKEADAQRAARKLVDEAYERGSLDNISAVVVKLKF